MSEEEHRGRSWDRTGSNSTALAVGGRETGPFSSQQSSTHKRRPTNGTREGLTILPATLRSRRRLLEAGPH